MFPTAEYFLTGEHAYRRERAADAFARGAGWRRPGAARRSGPLTVRRAVSRRLRNRLAVGH